MESTNNSLTAVAAQEGPSVSVVGVTYRIVIGSEQTNGAYALIDTLIPPMSLSYQMRVMLQSTVEF
jgi:hypothetical protein